MSNTTYSGHLQILDTEEIEDLYSIPDFDPEDRITFFTLSPDEYALMKTYRGVSSQVFFILQLGYFKAKHQFFLFTFEQQAADTAFVLKKYFPKSNRKALVAITKPTRLNQHKKICKLYEFTPFKESLLDELMKQASVFAKRHNHPIYLFRLLLQYLHNRRIILPAYSFFQRHVISQTIRTEQQRLAQVIETRLSKVEKNILDGLLEKPVDGMYPLTILQKEPSSLKYYQIRGQLKRSALLAPIYQIALKICKLMNISNENIRYYSSLAEEYKLFNLKQLKGNIRYVYLLCFAYHRYRSINDTLVEGLRYHLLNLEKDAEKFAEKQIYLHQLEANSSLVKVPQVLALFKDETLKNEVLFGMVRKIAFKILSPAEMDLVNDLIERNRLNKKELMWMFYHDNRRLISLYLRPLGLHFNFDNTTKSDELMEALSFVKQTYQDGKHLSQVPPADFPCSFLNKSWKKYIVDDKGEVVYSKYEMALYQTLRNKLEAGDIFVSDSFLHRSFEDDLLATQDWQINKPTIIKQADLPKLKKSVGQILEEWEATIEPLYKQANERIKKGLNPSVVIDGENKDGSTKWHLNYTDTSSPLNHQIYGQFEPIGIAPLLRLVDTHTDFLNAFTHLFATNVRRKTDKHKLIACIVAFGTNYGIGKMSKICDVSYQELKTTANTLIYLDTLKEANRRIANKTRTLPMYKHYNLAPGVVHSSSDGQKYYTQIPTINSRYSSKYFGLQKGLAALTAVADNIPINADIIGANEHESHYVLDLLYNNDTDIKPDIHSTDSHGINQVNFAILDMFGYRFAPRYKNISSKAKTIYSFQQPALYKDYLLKPIRKIDNELIEQEWDTFQRIIASLAMKTTTQSTIIRKLSSYKRNNRVKKAIVEYDNIVQTYHKLHYIDDPMFQKQVNTALNRGEHMNKLRKHLFHADGGKFKVHTVIEQKIWHECNRLIANAVIYYNTWLLSELLAYHEKRDNVLEVDLIKKVSPIAWQHIHIHGRYKFRIGEVILDILKMMSNVKI